MSSLPRRIQRRKARQSTDYEPSTQPTQMFADGGYVTLHPTKGYRYVSAGQIMAQRIISEMKQIIRNRR